MCGCDPDVNVCAPCLPPVPRSSPASPINPTQLKQESKSVPINSCITESMIGVTLEAPSEAEDTTTAMASTIVNVGDPNKSYSMRDDAPSASITHQVGMLQGRNKTDKTERLISIAVLAYAQGWETNSPRAASRTDMQKQPQQQQQQVQQQQGQEDESGARVEAKATKDDAGPAKSQPMCGCSIM
eukprot:1159864-Pelagomonas_calceolata.AAC.18